VLENTFIHIPGVGPTMEQSLWRQGCACWDDYLADGSKFSCGSASREAAVRTLERSKRALAFGEHQFFAKKLKQRHAWRAWEAFRDRCVYLDIETDGGVGGGSVTVVGLWDGSEFRALIKDDDLGNFPDIISHYSTIVTFFGTGFDLPVLQRAFSNLQFDQIHIDLHPVLGTLGYRGGLKRIEREFGLAREGEIDGLTGRDAITLWRRYRQLGDSNALQTLIDYNKADVVNLEVLAERAFQRMVDATYPAEFRYAAR
jgi:uncharacterized protein